MCHFKGKGKQKASPSPSPSSAEDDSAEDNVHFVDKKIRLSSPARVRNVALAKVASKSKSGSSSKGLASFATLVNNTSLSAAWAEMSRGLHSSSSSSRFRGVKPKVEKTVSMIAILFVVVA